MLIRLREINLSMGSMPEAPLQSGAAPHNAMHQREAGSCPAALAGAKVFPAPSPSFPGIGPKAAANDVSGMDFA